MWEAQCFVCACVYPWRKVFLCSVYTPFLLPSPLFSFLSPLFSFLHPPAPPITHPVSSWPNQQHSRDQDCLQQRRFVAANLKCQEYISWVESWSQRWIIFCGCMFMYVVASCVAVSIERLWWQRSFIFNRNFGTNTGIFFLFLLLHHSYCSLVQVAQRREEREKGEEGDGRRGRREEGKKGGEGEWRRGRREKRGREEREKGGRFMLTCNQWYSMFVMFISLSRSPRGRNRVLAEGSGVRFLLWPKCWYTGACVSDWISWVHVQRCGNTDWVFIVSVQRGILLPPNVRIKLASCLYFRGKKRS